MQVLKMKNRPLTLDDFIKKIYHRRYQAVWTAVVGANQTGKTATNLFIMERAQKLGLFDAFGANMPIEADFEIDFIEDFETLEQRCKMLNPNPAKHGIKRYLFLGSEMGVWLPRDQPWQNVEFLSNLQQVRKYGLSFLGDGVDRIDSRVLSPAFFHGYYLKPHKDNPKFAIYTDWTRKKQIRLKDIPLTNLGFDTWYKAKFFMHPQVKEGAIVPLNREHELVKEYMEKGSWSKVGVHPQEGKRTLIKVLEYHYTHCLHSVQKTPEEIASIDITSEELTQDSKGM